LETTTSPTPDNDQQRVAEEPLSGLVTWQGTLYDYGDVPLGNTRIVLSLQGCQRKGFSGNSNNEGRFEFREIPTGIYSVRLYTKMPSQTIDLSRVELTTPGLKEKDLFVASCSGAFVRGKVIYEATGELFKEERIAVAIYEEITPSREEDKSLIISISDDGTFYFRGVKKGTYHVAIDGPGIIVEERFRGLRISENQKEADLILRISPFGKLLVRLEGFEKEIIKEMQLFKGTLKTKNPASWLVYQKPIAVPEGKVTFAIGHKSLGRTTKFFDFVHGKTEEWVVLPSDFKFPEDGQDAFHVKGKLLKPDGSPVPNARIMYRTHKKNQAYCVTDENGCFCFESVIPGENEIYCALKDYGKDISPEKLGYQEDVPLDIPGVMFHHQEIPENPDESFSLDLVLPRSTVTGQLFDASSGNPIGNPNLHWQLILYDSKLSKAIAGLHNGRDSDFKLEYVPPGEFFLIANVHGYSFHYSNSFTIEEGRVLDLGRIELTPTGIIDIEVFNLQGQPIHQQVKGIVIDLVSTSGNNTKLTEYKTRIWGLPTGSVRIEVGTRGGGYKTKTLDLYLEPAVPLDVRVVLEPEDPEDSGEGK
ncbi:MAG: carboxypeptidase-like regulatory domain-containing protein, partial [Planctomycetes bacterium]|nr:carboxypeptidase-like regulatory domain-containing protein [Planctomycetota bacterium]